MPVRLPSLLLAAALTSAAVPVFTHAQPAPPIDPSPSGCFMVYIAADDPAPQVIPLESTEVVLDVKPGLLEAEVIQTFVNHTGTALEAIYQYPLPDGATLTDFELRYDDRVLRSEVREKQAARAVYERARDDGRKAALLERADPSLFRTSVANFMPGETVRAVIRFIQPTTFGAGAAEVRFPMVSGVKYTPPDAASASPGEVSIDPVRLPSFGPKHYYAFDIEVAGFPPATVTSPSHAISVEPASDGRVRVALAEDVTVPDRDFRLRIEPFDTRNPRPALALQHGIDGDYGLLTLFPPMSRAVSERAARPRDIMFLLDRSGSMAGTRFASAKLGLDACLQTLLPGDRFQIAVFESAFEFAAPDWQAVDLGTIDAARRYVRDLQTGGGTEMQPALAACLDRFQPDPARDQFLIFLTDGDVGVEQSLFALIREKIGDVRLFTFGIGQAPNVRLINRMAELGRGQARFIADDREVARELEDLFATLDAPLLRELEVDLLDATGAPIPVRAFPDRWGHLFRGRPLQVTFRSDAGARPTRAVITGFEDDRPVRHDFALDASPLRGHGIARYFGGKEYQRLEDQRDQLTLASERAPLEADMLATALKYQLVTEFTSRVAVSDRRSRDPSAPLTTEHVGQALPADLAGAGYLPDEDVIVLSAFEVSAEEGATGYLCGTTLAGSRLNTNLRDIGSAVTVITAQFLHDVAATTPEKLLDYATPDSASENFLNVGATHRAMVDGLDIKSLLDLATVQSLVLPEAGLDGSHLTQPDATTQSVRELVLRADDQGRAAATLTWGGPVSGASRELSLLSVLSGLDDGSARQHAYVAAAGDHGDLRWDARAQASHFGGYGDAHLVGASATYAPHPAFSLQLKAAQHALRRDDPSQFTRANPHASYNGLGASRLDLLTAETRRLDDTIGQFGATGQLERGDWNHRLMLSGEWHRQQADWLAPAVVTNVADRRETRSWETTYGLTWAPLNLSLESRFAVRQVEEPALATPRWHGHESAFGLTWTPRPTLTFYAKVAETTGRAWITSGRYAPTAAGWRRAAPPRERRREWQAGVNLNLLDGRLRATTGLFHLRINDLAYRDWAWEQQHPGVDTLTPAGDLRRAISYAVWPEAVLAGIQGSLVWNPVRSLTVQATWNATWTNDGPYAGGDHAWSVATFYTFAGGRLEGFELGGALRARDDLYFNDGYRLRGGAQADLFVARRWINATAGKATELRLNLSDLADRGGAATRFSSDEGRCLRLTLSHEF